MSRQELANIYLDWRNNYLTVEKFAEHYGLYLSEARMLIELSKSCNENQHPEQ